MRALGYLTVTLGEVQYSKDEILRHIGEAQSHCSNAVFNQSDFLHDLCHAVPLLVHEGDQYRWSHKSLQEYFAAQFICIDTKGSQAAILEKMYASRSLHRFYNVLDLCYDIDYKTFRSVLLYQVAGEFLSYARRGYRWARERGIPIEEIRRRQALTFGRTIMIYPMRQDYRAVGLLDARAIEVLKKRERVRKVDELVLLSEGPDGERGAFILVMPEKPAALICELIADKGDRLITPRPVVSNVSAGPRGRDDELLAKRHRKPTLIHENPSSPINTRRRFVKATDYVSRFPIACLDFDQCVELRQAVEASNSNGDADFLLGRL